MALHGDVGVEMVQGTVGLLAAVPTALVHALDLLIPSARSLVLLRARDGYERVHLLSTILSTQNQPFHRTNKKKT